VKPTRRRVATKTADAASEAAAGVPSENELLPGGPDPA
jgi:hypothetical protein